VSDYRQCIMWDNSTPADSRGSLAPPRRKPVIEVREAPKESVRDQARTAMRISGKEVDPARALLFGVEVALDPVRSGTYAA